MTKGTDIRELALGILLEVSAGEEYSHIALRNVLDKYQYLEKQERAFLTRLVEGTLERRIELDYIIDQFSSVKVRKQKPVIRELLRMSVYQLKYMQVLRYFRSYWNKRLHISLAFPPLTVMMRQLRLQVRQAQPPDCLSGQI